MHSRALPLLIILLIYPPSVGAALLHSETLSASADSPSHRGNCRKGTLPGTCCNAPLDDPFCQSLGFVSLA